jgi:hypothetical protein
MFDAHFALGVLECAGAPAFSRVHADHVGISMMAALVVIANFVRNLFARQSGFI